MIYNEFKGKKISALGMGCMRLPSVEKEVNIEETKALIDHAIKKGINYFDTAWIYHGEKSESIMGDILKNYPRDSYFLATKFPGFDRSYMERKEEIFEEQLKRCQTDYFDFYLFHNVCEKNIDGFLDEKLGVYSYLKKQKENGRIRHLGFSTHGSLSTIKRFLDACGKDLEFCQLQVNWLDWKLQNAKAKIELVSSYGIPVWVMESVRGGRLAKLEDDYEARLRALRPDASAAEWAFRFLQGVPEVVVSLSGMSNFEQLEENIKTYETEKPLSEKEKELLANIADEIIAKTALPCTSCKYCVEYCPMELDIPSLIGIYNEHKYSGNGRIPYSATSDIAEDKRASACISCRSCEAVCPQGIKISEMMKDFEDRAK